MNLMRARFDPSVPEFIANPYSTYAALREQEPIHWSPHRREWVSTGYADVKRILSDPRFGATRHVDGAADSLDPPPREDPLVTLSRTADRSLGLWMVHRNPPEHTRLRVPLNQDFSKSTVERWRPFIQARADYLLDRVWRAREMDVMSDFAQDLPFTVICEIMGVPVQDRPQLYLWLRDMRGFLGLNRTAMIRSRGAIALLKAQTYFIELARRCRHDPGDDVFSRMLYAYAGDGNITEEEIAGNALVLMIGGEANASAMIGMGLWVLANHPEQRHFITEHPEHIPQAVEELLRFEAPLHFVTRIALEDTALDGKTIKQGERVRALIGAANRDPSAFSEPDRLDLTRSPNLHPSFGAGIHYCIGAPLARLELEVVFTAFLNRMPHYVLVPGALNWNERFFPRGVRSLPVRF
jgi:cytochrome P450